MDFITDIEFSDYLRCAGLWWGIRNGYKRKYDPSIIQQYFRMFIFEDPNLPEWQIEHASLMFYGSNKGDMKRDYATATEAAMRLISDPYISKIIFESEEWEFESQVHGIRVKFQMNGIDNDGSNFIVPVLGPKRLTQKRAVDDGVNGVEYMSWIVADNWPQMLGFYREAIYSTFLSSYTPLLAVAESRECPDIQLYDLTNPVTNNQWKVKEAINTMAGVIEKTFDPALLEHCGQCEYCLSKKQITGPVVWNEFE